MYVHTCLCGYIHMSTISFRGQERALGPLPLELQTAVSYPVGNGSSGRAAEFNFLCLASEEAQLWGLVVSVVAVLLQTVNRQQSVVNFVNLTQSGLTWGESQKGLARSTSVRDCLLYEVDAGRPRLQVGGTTP